MIVILSCVWSLNCCIWIYISSAFLHVTLVWLWFFFNFLLSFMLVLTRLDLAGNDAVSLSANHLQKLRFSFQLTTPHGHVFKPNQVCSRLLDLLNESFQCCLLRYLLFCRRFSSWDMRQRLNTSLWLEIPARSLRKFSLSISCYILFHCLGFEVYPWVLVQFVTLYDK